MKQSAAFPGVVLFQAVCGSKFTKDQSAYVFNAAAQLSMPCFISKIFAVEFNVNLPSRRK